MTGRAARGFEANMDDMHLWDFAQIGFYSIDGDFNRKATQKASGSTRNGSMYWESRDKVLCVCHVYSGYMFIR